MGMSIGYDVLAMLTWCVVRAWYAAFVPIDRGGVVVVLAIGQWGE
jgi:hypothetical protein